MIANCLRLRVLEERAGHSPLPGRCSRLRLLCGDGGRPGVKVNTHVPEGPRDIDDEPALDNPVFLHVRLCAAADADAERELNEAGDDASDAHLAAIGRV